VNQTTTAPGSADRQQAFLAALADLDQWLTGHLIPYAIFGSVAASAWTDQGASLDFDRPGARDPAERIPDIDLLVPRVSLPAVRAYARAARSATFPVSIDTFWSACWIDFRPGQDTSYLTHRRVRLPVRTIVFTPCTASLFGHDVTVLDPLTLLHLYGTVGVTRRKDTPRITALTTATQTAAPARFTATDCEAFTRFMHARRRRYPVFFAAKHAWVMLLDALPPAIAHALTHHVQLHVNQAFRLITSRAGQSAHGSANSLAHSPM
jgi:hypothetical protein